MRAMPKVGPGDAYPAQAPRSAAVTGPVDYLELYSRLLQMPSTMFDEVLLRVGVDRALISPPLVPQATRAQEVTELARLDVRLAQRLADEVDSCARRPTTANAYASAGTVATTVVLLALSGTAVLGRARPLLDTMFGTTAGFVLWLLLPASIVALGLRLASASHPEERMRRPWYAHGLKFVGALLALSGSVLFVARLARSAPTMSATVLDGYVCDVDHQVDTSADLRVFVRDATRRVVSNEDSPDDDGRVRLHVRPWAFRPLEIMVDRVSGDCGTADGAERGCAKHRTRAADHFERSSVGANKDERCRAPTESR